jgi:D-alanyl-D-alanine carboxypeptidase
MKRLATILVLGLGLFVTIVVSGRSVAAPPGQAEFARYAGDLLVRNYRAEGPGAAVLVARGDTVLFRAARGLADVDGRVALRPDAVFRIGSVTKQFTAAGLLTLVDAGRVRLDDPLSKYIEDYPGGDRITLLQLLNHTSGVKDYSGLPRFVDVTIRNDTTTKQLVDLIKTQPAEFAPGSRWAYNNSGYVLIGAVIEAVSGQPWHAYLDQALFKPLGMHHTGYGHDPKFAMQQVRGYSFSAGKIVPPRPLSMTQPHAAGSLVSNVDDLLTWSRALHEGRVLKTAAYTQMVTPVGKAADAGIGYGFGMFNGLVRKTNAFQHGGRIFGFVASLTYLPQHGVSVIVLENSDTPLGSDNAESLSRKLAAMAAGDPYPELRAVPVDAAALREAEGVYRFDAETVRVLRVVDGKLTSQRDTRTPIVLTPIANDDFLYADGFTRLKLERAGGRVNSARFFANGDGDGQLGHRTNDPLPPIATPLQLPPAALARLTGAYAADGLTLKIFIDGEALKAQIVGQLPVGLRAKSPTLFDVEDSGATLEFPPGAEPATEVTMRQHERQMVLKRIA